MMALFIHHAKSFGIFQIPPRWCSVASPSPDSQTLTSGPGFCPHPLFVREQYLETRTCVLGVLAADGVAASCSPQGQSQGIHVCVLTHPQTHFRVYFCNHLSAYTG